MPASIDLGQYAQVTHSPVERLDLTLARLPKFDVQELLQGWIDGIKLVTGLDFSSPLAFMQSIGQVIVDFIKDLTGIDLSGFIELLNGIGEMLGINNLFQMLEDIVAVFTSIDLTDPTSIIVAIGALINIAVKAITDAVEDIFDVGGWFANLSAFLGSIDFLDPNFDLMGAAQSFIELVLSPAGLPAISDVLAAIMGTYTGTDLALPQIQDIFTFFRDLFGGIDFESLPTSPAEVWQWVFASFLAPLIDAVQSILDPLTGLIPDWLLPPVSIGRLTSQAPNLVEDGGFSVVPHGDSEWRNVSGVVEVTADGTHHELILRPVGVAAGQEYRPEVEAGWVSASGAAGSVQLQLLEFLRGVQVGIHVVASATPTGTQALSEIAATYTVPAGVDQVALALVVTSGATAGIIRFDNADGPPTGVLQLDWMPDALANFEGLFGAFGGTLADGVAKITNVINNVLKIFGIPDISQIFGSPGVFDPTAILQNFISAMLYPLNMLAQLVAGFIPGAQIPGLDASKIVSGSFPRTLVADLQQLYNNLGQGFTNTPGTYTAQGVFQAFTSFRAILGEGNSPLSSVQRVFDENLQTKQVLSGVVITPINSIMTAIKAWYDSFF